MDEEDWSKPEISLFTGRSSRFYLGPKKKCSILHENISFEDESKM